MVVEEAGHFSWKHGDSTQWERFNSMGWTESMPLSLTTPPWSCRDKSPRILLWRGREERALECGDTSYSATLARSPQAFKAPRACNRRPTPCHARVLKQATGTMLPPDFLPQGALHGLDGHPCTLGKAASLGQGFAVQESQFRVYLKQSEPCRAV